MTTGMYSIRDEKAQAFNVPFFFTTQGQALRAFQDLAQDANTTIGKHPEDYRLYHHGDFDLDAGTFNARATPFYLAAGSDFAGLNATPLKRVP